MKLFRRAWGQNGATDQGEVQAGPANGAAQRGFDGISEGQTVEGVAEKVPDVDVHSESDYLTDAPICDAEQDRFGRSGWALRVAETISAQQDPASLVVGVYAPWGDGKTSVLNLIFETLDEKSGTIPVRFNPWRIGDETEMFHGFFATVADALDEKLATGAERAGQALRDYGGLFGFIPVAGDALKAGAGVAGAKLSETNLAKQRSKVERLLAQRGQRIVILIDDIDRLDKSEIQAMFRLVKAAADFRHTAYVMAFDHLVVANALAERYSTGSPHGASFMDKIVQLPLHLPPAPAERLREVALKAVDNALDQSKITLTQAQVAAFVSVFDRAVGPQLTTPRAANRFGNALLFALPMIGAEVNPVDLMLLESMRICYPALYEWARSHQQEVLGPHPSGTKEEPPLVSIRDSLVVATTDLNEEASMRAKVLLTTLFPRTESAWDNKVWPGEWDTTWAEEKRVASRLYFRRYFSYSVPPGDVADADIDALVAAAEAAEPDVDTVISLAVAVLSAEGAESVLPKLAARAPNLSSGAAANLAMVVPLVSQQLSDRPEGFGLSAFERAAILVRDLFRQVDQGMRGELAVTLVREPYPPSFSVELIRWLRPSQDEAAQAAVLTESEADAAGRALADRLLAIWQSDDPFSQLARRAATALHVCSVYGDGDRLREDLRHQIEHDVAFAINLMRSFLGQSWSMETGEQLVARLHRENYEAIGEFVDPSWLVPLLQQRFGDDLGTYAIEFRPKENEDARLASEYVAFFLSDLDNTKGVEPSTTTGPVEG